MHVIVGNRDALERQLVEELFRPTAASGRAQELANRLALRAALTVVPTDARRSETATLDQP